jgi:hypothetical protein
MDLYRLKSLVLLIDTLNYFNLVINKNFRKNELFFSIIDSFFLALFLELFYNLILYFIRNCLKFTYIFILLFFFLLFILYTTNILFKPIKIIYQ